MFLGPIARQRVVRRRGAPYVSQQKTRVRVAAVDTQNTCIQSGEIEGTGAVRLAKERILEVPELRAKLERVRPFHPGRSEEHTSELPSLRHLVCRLLLEKNTHA